jgi:hypothetical protein
MEKWPWSPAPAAGRVGRLPRAPPRFADGSPLRRDSEFAAACTRLTVGMQAAHRPTASYATALPGAVRRPRRTAKPPNSMASAVLADAVSISGTPWGGM